MQNSNGLKTSKVNIHEFKCRKGIGDVTVPLESVLKGLCHPTRMREQMKTNLKKLARLFQVLSEILEGCFYLSKSQPSFDS